MVPIIREKHPAAFGKPCAEYFPSNSPPLLLYEQLKISRKGIFRNNECISVYRDNYLEEGYFSYSVSPILKEDGTFFAMMNLSEDTTHKVLSSRRLKLLGELGSRFNDAESLESACNIITDTLHKNDKDIPYALIYLIDNNNSNSRVKPRIAYLSATTFDKDQKMNDKKSKWHIPDKLLKTLEIVDLTRSADESYDEYVEIRRNVTTHLFLKCKSWPIHLVIKEDKHVKVILNDESQAVLFPVKIESNNILSAILICGINPFRPLDEDYMEFLQSVVNQVGSILRRGVLREEEKNQMEMLADLNRQKVTLFQNISHELRTPLSLVLSPLDEAINLCIQEIEIHYLLQIVQRNTRRLLKLVNNLLQTSSIETGQLEIHYRKTNIAKLTKELAANFNNLASKLNIEYIIDVPNSDDFDQALQNNNRNYYIKILALLKGSNAFKHTQNGCIKVRLYIDRESGRDIIILEVSDTGIGISETDLKNLFQRFYRAESHQSRRYEGTGIGLALVKELITCHGGDISVTSKIDQGTTFKCQFLTGYEHLPTNKIYSGDEEILDYDEQLSSKQQWYLEENLQWIQNNHFENREYTMDQDIYRSSSWNVFHNNTKHKVLIVDDNIDMRNYIEGLLRKDFDVCCACDGRDALQLLTNLPTLPDLVLSDVMMPNMNGYELLNELRSNMETKLIPVILLTAKAGERFSIKGFDDGANDYIVKPFNSRQLIARIHTNIKLSKFRYQIISRLCKQEERKQLLISISDSILSGLDLKEALSKVVKEVYQMIPCDRIFIILSETQNRTMVALFEDPETNSEYNATNNLLPEQLKIEEFLEIEDQVDTFSAQNDNAFQINVSHDTYCVDTNRQVSMLSARIISNNRYFGWIKAHRSPDYIWDEAEIELFQQISDQINIAINNVKLTREKMIKEAHIEAINAANVVKTQILANTSHELRTPLGAIVGILSTIKDDNLTDEQRGMINIMLHSSDTALSTINNILNAAKLEAHKLSLDNKAFDLFDLLENTIDIFGETVGDKQIELILNYDMNTVPRYVKSDPERLKQILIHLLSNSTKFTKKGEIMVTISMKSWDITNENTENETSAQLHVIKKAKLLIEVNDTGVGINPEFMQSIWESYSMVDTSIVRQHNGSGLGLFISKQLVEINNGEIGAESKLEKGSKFWFTWNIELLPISTTLKTLNFNTDSLQISSSDTKVNRNLLSYIRFKRILLIHPFENARNAIITFLKNIERVGVFDTCDKGIRAAKEHKELFNQAAYDIAFINLYEKDMEEVTEAALKLKMIHEDNLSIVFMVFPSIKGRIIAKKLTDKIGGNAASIFKPITYKKVINQCLRNNNLKTEIENSVKNSISYNIQSLPLKNL
ncbi:2598_t:CDS:10 [Scutellospora calospora]|uniref:2598_t:CDS:1 n=1 Tax=Scutellospora calospora TaxID=85575 RepID=A0ACA9JTX1_9GLOM|nr:2598_t:CDS:10 [Scutellospora calospora]